jgi:hypothetical protein
MHLYFKRTKANQAALGDTSHHRDRVACILGFQALQIKRKGPDGHSSLRAFFISFSKSDNERVCFSPPDQYGYQ